MKPKRWKKIRRSGMNLPRGTSRATMGIISRDFVDTRKNYLIPTLSQCWGIPLQMLSAMCGWTLRMVTTLSIGWRARAVFLHLCLTRKYRISWLCTCKVRNGIWVAGLVSWKNHGLKKNWRWFSLFFAPINCVVVVTPWRRWRGNSPSNSTAWRRILSSMEIMSFTPRHTLLERYSNVRKIHSSNQPYQ